MGSFRGGLILTLLPAAAQAGVCDTARPAWDGEAVSALSEAMYLFATVPSLVLLLASAVAIRFRHQWGALVVVVLWTILVSLIALSDPSTIQAQAIAEGCIGSPTLFIAAVAAICVGMILYTAPLKKQAD